MISAPKIEGNRRKSNTLLSKRHWCVTETSRHDIAPPRTDWQSVIVTMQLSAGSGCMTHSPLATIHVSKNYRRKSKEIWRNRRKSKEIYGAEIHNFENPSPGREVNYISWLRHIRDDHVTAHDMWNGHKNLTRGFSDIEHFMLLLFSSDFLRFCISKENRRIAKMPRTAPAREFATSRLTESRQQYRVHRDCKFGSYPVNRITFGVRVMFRSKFPSISLRCSFDFPSISFDFERPDFLRFSRNLGFSRISAPDFTYSQ